MLAMAALAACGIGGDALGGVAALRPPTSPTAQEGAVDAQEGLSVDLEARVSTPGEPAGWTVRGGWGPLAEERRPSPGVCRRPRGPAPSAPAALVGMEVRGPTETVLSWDPESGLWSAGGPRQSLDPAWSVSDILWTDAAGPHVAPDEARFGGLPVVSSVSRDREGVVTIRWDAATVENPVVLVSGPGGVLECGAEPDGATLPWWSVPAWGGEVVLRSTREHLTVVDGALLRVRTTLERVIELDRPAGTTAEEKAPAFEPYSPRGGPTRIQRARKPPVG